MSFGIDHPLVAAGDFAGAAVVAERLGFTLNPFHQHPWGTCNHLLLFDSNMIELIGIDRPDRLEIADDNGFRFGQMIASRLELGDGIAMTALESTDMTRDHATLVKRGYSGSGTVTFRRQGHGLEGRSEEVAVSLDMLISDEVPWFSQFLCEQHNPGLLRADPAWQRHTNTVHDIEAVWCVAEEPSAHYGFFAQIHGEQAINPIRGGLRVVTEKGVFYIVTPGVLAEAFPLLADVVPTPSRPLALTLSCRDLQRAKAGWRQADIPFAEPAPGRADIPPSVFAGTLLSIVESSA